MSMADAVASGGAFGGCKPVDKGDVLLLDLEGNRRRAQIRFKKLRQGGKAPAGLDVANEWPRMDRGGLDLIRQWAKARKKPAAGHHRHLGEVQAAPAQERRPLPVRLRLREAAAGAGPRAGRGDPRRPPQPQGPGRRLAERAVSGSQGLAGGADTIIVIERDRAKADAVLHVTGRDLEEQELALSFDKDTGRWTIIGDAAEHRQSETRRRVYGLLSAQGAMAPKDIAEELGLKRNAVKQHLLRVICEGAVKGAGGGRYVLPRPGGHSASYAVGRLRASART